MLNEQELLDLITDRLDIIGDGTPELRDVACEKAPTEAAAAVITLVDGSRFLLTVVQIEEGE